ncbi:MAG: CapA family protein [Deltaproteobacteria bacterium]|nr:CapA family protein [Deltaproteobacteria bacterium]
MIFHARGDHKIGRLSVVVLLLGVFASVLVAMLVGWFSFWTYLDPPVDVPSPIEARFGYPGTGDKGRVLFLGDFAPTDAAMPLIEKRGFGYPFDATRKIVRSYDATVANLEAPITTSDTPSPRRPKKYVYKVHPDAVEEIRRAGIDVVTLANNHGVDYGNQGLADTLRYLDAGGILHVGAHMSEAGARRGVVLDTPGGRLGILSYMQNKLHWRIRNLAFALDTPFRKWPGIARLRYRDLAEDIAQMKKLVDIVAVVVHWGENYAPVDEQQATLGKACIDLGADIVIGHHPHWYQPVRLYREKPIIYSLGNYAFGTPGHYKMRFGMGAALHLKDGQIDAVELIPLLTQNRIVKFQPRVPRGKHLERFFSGLLEPSRELGAEIERRGNRGWLAMSAVGMKEALW